MGSRRRRKKSPLRLSVELFTTCVILIVVAILANAFDTSCSNVGYIQECVQYTYDGLDSRTFGIVLSILAVLCFAGGVYYLMRHKKSLEEGRNAGTFPVSRPSAPQQPDSYAPLQNTFPKGNDRGEVPFQPPSNTPPHNINW